MNVILQACRGMAESKFKEGEDLIREGGRGARIYILERGEVIISKGMVEVSRTRAPGSLFGEMSALLAIPYTATVTAASPVRAYRVDQGREFLGAHPEIALHAATGLAQRLHSATTYLADMKEQTRAKGAELDALNDMMQMLLQKPEEEGADTA